MPEDSYTEVTHESWFSRIGGALKGIIIGLIFFLAAFPLLFWNEGRAVKQQKTLKEGAGAVISIDAENFEPRNDGRLVHIIAKADTETTLKDPEFGINVTALKLKRIVEMYQWKESSHSETQKKIGGGTKTVTTYTYNKTWSDSLISSSRFKKTEGHRNPENMPYRSLQKTADLIHVGAFTLSPSLTRKISNFSRLPISDGIDLPAEIKARATRQDDSLFFGNNPHTPEIGDVRVYFKVARPAMVSLIAKQTGSTFTPYETHAGGTIELLQTGSYGADKMIEKAQQRNSLITWGIRIGGFILMVLGLITVLRPLEVLADVVPLLGSIVGAGTGIIAFLSALVLSLLTIAVAWIVYRPLFGSILAVVALSVILLMKIKLKSGRPPVLAPPPPPAV